MSDVPNEIYLEILKLVPVESLFRFRSVCKTWRDIIDNSNFAKKHIHGGIGGQWFFYMHNNGKIFLSSINELISKRSSSFMHATNVKTLGGADVPRMPEFPVPSCNGLILLSSRESNLVWRIWNPFTGESLEIGLCNELPNVTDEDYCRPTSGIGYDEPNDDYKVVNIVGVNTYIYSVNLEMWRKIGNFPDSHIGHTNGVFADDALHWIVYSTEEYGDLGWIVALDISTEIYRKIALPLELTEDDWRGTKLNALSGCLFLSCAIFEGHYFVMWMIKDYGCGDTWTKMISLESTNLICPLAYSKSNGFVLLHCSEWDYLWYDVERSSAEMLSIEINLKKSICYHYTYQVYPASLIRLKKSNTMDESVASQGMSKRKRKKKIATAERLPLKVFFRDSADPPSDDAPALSNGSCF